MTGGVRLEDISIRGSGAAGGGCCGTALQKTLDVRACLPRGALAFAFSGHFPLPTYFLSPVPAPRNFLRVRTGGPGGSPSHIRRSPPRSAFALSLSPLTPSDRHASRPRRGPQRTSDQPATFTEYSHFQFFFVSHVQRRSSDLFCILGQHACTTTRTKHVVFPVTRPHKSDSSQNTISRCQGNSRSGRPVVVHGAPQPPARDRAFVFPRRPCPPPPARSTFDRDHHIPMPSSHVHLFTTAYMPTVTSMIL